MAREHYALEDVGILGDKPTVCGWFLKCTNAPTHIVSHPILEWVATCERCKDFATE